MKSYDPMTKFYTFHMKSGTQPPHIRQHQPQYHLPADEAATAIVNDGSRAEHWLAGWQ